MIERRRHLRFALETPARVRVEKVLRQELHGDRAIQRRIGGGANDAHPARPDTLADQIVAESTPGERPVGRMEKHRPLAVPQRRPRPVLPSAQRPVSRPAMSAFYPSGLSVKVGNQGARGWCGLSVEVGGSSTGYRSTC